MTESQKELNENRVKNLGRFGKLLPGVLGQAMYALECGATREEILETISVVVSMRGTRKFEKANS